MKKIKLVSLVLTFVAIVALSVVILVLPASAETEGYYTYTVSSGEAQITKVDTAISGDVTIPDMLGGYPVTSIAHDAFYDCSRILNVTIPENITRIGYGAFGGCINLIQKENGISYVDKWVVDCDESKTSVSFRENTVGIAANAFSYCRDLTNIVIPDSITIIDDNVFYSCSVLTSVTLGNSVTHIGDYAFYFTNLLEITIPETVTEIGDYAFYNCINLVNISPLKNVNSIGMSAFQGCGKLKSVITGENLQNLGAGAFQGCWSLENIIISEGVTNIGNFTFSGCAELTSIIIPKGTLSIGAYVFSGCSQLISIAIPDSVTSISEDTLGGCTSLEKIHCSEGSYAQTYATNNSINVEFCSGGEVTCTSQKICSTCGNEYGDEAALGHDFTVKMYDETYHWKKCSRCDEISEKSAHSGGTATCTEQAKCSVCDKEYGDLKAHMGGAATCTQNAKCSVCGNEYGELAAHDFSIAQSDAEQHWNKCSKCDATDEKQAHTGGTASCTQKAKCTACGNEYGELAAHDFSIAQSDTKQHWNKCSRCDATDTKRAHSFGTDNKCTVCKYQKVAEVDNTTPEVPDNSQGSTNGGNSTEETTNNQQTETERTKQETPAPENKGCGASLGGAVSVAAICTLAAAFAGKKKKSED